MRGHFRAFFWSKSQVEIRKIRGHFALTFSDLTELLGGACLDRTVEEEKGVICLVAQPLDPPLSRYRG